MLSRALVLFVVLLLGACATVPEVPPLSGAQLVEMARQGQSADRIIAELQRTRTVLALKASDIVALHEAGVPRPVLDYLQRAQMADLVWRDRYQSGFSFGAGYGRGFMDCPFGYRPGLRRPLGSPFC